MSHKAYTPSTRSLDPTRAKRITQKGKGFQSYTPKKTSTHEGYVQISYDVGGVNDGASTSTAGQNKPDTKASARVVPKTQSNLATPQTQHLSLSDQLSIDLVDVCGLNIMLESNLTYQSRIPRLHSGKGSLDDIARNNKGSKPMVVHGIDLGENVKYPHTNGTAFEISKTEACHLASLLWEAVRDRQMFEHISCATKNTKRSPMTYLQVLHQSMYGSQLWLFSRYFDGTFFEEDLLIAAAHNMPNRNVCPICKGADAFTDSADPSKAGLGALYVVQNALPTDVNSEISESLMACGKIHWTISLKHRVRDTGDVSDVAAAAAAVGDSGIPVRYVGWWVHPTQSHDLAVLPGLCKAVQAASPKYTVWYHTRMAYGHVHLHAMLSYGANAFIADELVRDIQHMMEVEKWAGKLSRLDPLPKGLDATTYAIILEQAAAAIALKPDLFTWVMKQGKTIELAIAAFVAKNARPINCAPELFVADLTARVGPAYFCNNYGWARHSSLYPKSDIPLVKGTSASVKLELAAMAKGITSGSVTIAYSANRVSGETVKSLPMLQPQGPGDSSSIGAIKMKNILDLLAPEKAPLVIEIGCASGGLVAFPSLDGSVYHGIEQSAFTYPKGVSVSGVGLPIPADAHHDLGNWMDYKTFTGRENAEHAMKLTYKVHPSWTSHVHLKIFRMDDDDATLIKSWITDPLQPVIILSDMEGFGDLGGRSPQPLADWISNNFPQAQYAIKCLKAELQGVLHIKSGVSRNPKEFYMTNAKGKPLPYIVHREVKWMVGNMEGAVANGFTSADDLFLIVRPHDVPSSYQPSAVQAAPASPTGSHYQSNATIELFTKEALERAKDDREPTINTYVSLKYPYHSVNGRQDDLTRLFHHHVVDYLCFVNHLAPPHFCCGYNIWKYYPSLFKNRHWTFDDASQSTSPRQTLPSTASSLVCIAGTFHKSCSINPRGNKAAPIFFTSDVAPKVDNVQYFPAISFATKTEISFSEDYFYLIMAPFLSPPEIKVFKEKYADGAKLFYVGDHGITVAPVRPGHLQPKSI
jgi:hypothetical protein